MKPGRAGPHPEPDFELADRFKDAMSLLAGTVSIITAGTGEQRRGLTATAVCSVSAQPPVMLVCVNRYGEAHKAISGAGFFCVNLLSEADQQVADSFAGRGGKSGVEKFSDGSWVDLHSGAPALTTAMASLDCEVVEVTEAHTHSVFFGAVREIRRGTGFVPLLHFARRYRQLSSEN